MIPWPVYFFLLIELIAVSYGDIRFKKIPNKWIFLNIITYLLLLFIYPSHYKLIWPIFIFPVAFFIVGFFLYALKIMGGGDSKFLSSFYLLIPYLLQEEAFFHLLCVTIMIGGGIFLYHTFLNIKKIFYIIRFGEFYLFKKIYGTKFTYAPVILLSWITLGIVKGVH